MFSASSECAYLYVGRHLSNAKPPSRRLAYLCLSNRRKEIIWHSAIMLMCCIGSVYRLLISAIIGKVHGFLELVLYVYAPKNHVPSQ